MKKTILVFLLSLSAIASAKRSVISTCSGYVTADNQAVSFQYVKDSQDTGDSASEIAIYVKDLTATDAPNNYLGAMDCESEVASRDGKIQSCKTTLGETYTVDLQKWTGTERGMKTETLGYQIDYPTCR